MNVTNQSCSELPASPAAPHGSAVWLACTPPAPKPSPPGARRFRRRTLVAAALCAAILAGGGYGWARYDSQEMRAAHRAVERVYLPDDPCVAMQRTLQRRAQAELGDALAQQQLGISYEFSDQAESAKWFRLAAEQGLAESQYYFGRCCLDGRGVTQDSKAGMIWILKAAEQDYCTAQFALWVAYGDGRHVPQNKVAAAYWHQRANDTMANRRCEPGQDDLAQDE